MDALQELIIETVDERYPSDASFYRKFGFNSGRWSDFKSGRTDINNMKYERVDDMIRSLFTPFEMGLLKQAKFKKSINNTITSALDEYKRMKIEFIKGLSDNLIASISSTLYDGSQINNTLVIRHKDYAFLEVIEPNINPPAGKRNRREFILNYYNNFD